MGAGDMLMAMGEARELYRRVKRPVMIVGRDGRPVPDRDGLTKGVPYILTRHTNSTNYEKLMNGPGVRPYIAGKAPERWAWKPYRPKPAQLVFTREELDFAERYRGAVMIEPNVKAIGHDNKAWFAPHWPVLLARLREAGIATVQCVPGGVAGIADRIALTPSFRYAAAVLSVSRAFIGTEGGLMHAAAAVGTPAVIIWTEFIDPTITGYESHRNLRAAARTCGMRVNCPSCHKSAEAITPSLVLDNLLEILNEKS